LDPLADKATQFTLIICLAIRNPVIWTLVILFVIKEGFQLVAGLLTLRKGKMLTGAIISGKICTTILFVSLIILVMMPHLSTEAIAIITMIDCISMLAAFIGYAKVYYTKSPMIQQLDAKKDNE
jgi:cardiolipin synthase